MTELAKPAGQQGRPQGQGQQQRRRRPKSNRPREKAPKPEWKPRTGLGKAILAGKYDKIDAVWEQGKVIREPEALDHFFPELEERILKIGYAKRPFRWVQRMTDSGRRNTYQVLVAVGNKDGYVGVGSGRGKEFGTAIAQGIRNAKLNVIRVKRACGSWECGCSSAHSVPIKTTGKTGSVKIELIPAPKGTGLIVNYITKDILELAGVRDAWSSSDGHTKTRANVVYATFKALQNIGNLKGGYI